MKLYKTENREEFYEIENLESDEYVPMLDDPVDDNEVLKAFKDMKKSGYDYSMPTLNILVTSFLTVVN